MFFWATATWWIPMLVILGFWRHVYKRFLLTLRARVPRPRARATRSRSGTVSSLRRARSSILAAEVRAVLQHNDDWFSHYVFAQRGARSSVEFVAK